MTKVFLSSVARGLKPYRDAVCRAIGRLDNHHYVRMEDFGARDSIPEEVCRQKISECDIFVCILGHEYGSQPLGSEISYTELEYTFAGSLKKTRLAFLAPEEFPVSAHLIESDALREKQRLFRQRVKTEATVNIFDEDTREPALATLVVTAIHNCRADLIRDHPETITSANEKTRLLFPFISQSQGFDNWNCDLKHYCGPLWNDSA